MHVTHKVQHNKRVTHKSIQDSKGYAKIAPNVSQSSVLGTPKIAPMSSNVTPSGTDGLPKRSPDGVKWPPHDHLDTRLPQNCKT